MAEKPRKAINDSKFNAEEQLITIEDAFSDDKLDEMKKTIDGMKEQMKANELEVTNTMKATKNLKKIVDDSRRELDDVKKKAEEREQVQQDGIKQLKEMFEQELRKLREEVKITKQELQHQVEINQQLLQDLKCYDVPKLQPHLIGTGSQVIPAVVKIAEFERCKKVNKYWQSPAFYTSAEGYKMCLKITPNGVGAGNGTHVSVDAYLMKGEYDDQLTWPARGVLTVQILNQSGNSHHGSMVKYKFIGVNSCRVTEKEVSAFGVYSDKFISHKNLYVVDGRYQYFKNDCVFFQVVDFQQEL